VARGDRNLTSAELRAALSYDPDTGEFRWRHGRRAGAVAGYRMPIGYVQIQIDGNGYLAHRLAVLYMTGEWPALLVDHVDRDCANNKWANLRPATYSQNGANRAVSRSSQSGAKGVWWRSDRRKWRASITHDKKKMYIGCFDDFDAAVAAYDEAAKRLNQDFARTNSMMESS
jgi:hypothetical protein